MKKLIRLEAVDVFDNRRLCRFGKCIGINRGAEEFEASNGIKLISTSFPIYDSKENILYLPGESKELDSQNFFVSVQDYLEIIKAIEEFNNHYKGDL